MKRSYFEEFNSPKDYYNKLHVNARSRANRRVSNSSGHSALGRYVSQASGAALGFIAGDVPGAIEGMEFGGNLYDYAYPEPTVDDAMDAAYPKKSKEMGGQYKGRFLARKSPSTWDDMCKKKGYHVTLECFGSVSDPNAVYLQHSTWDSKWYAHSFVGAALRKLFKKAGIDVNDKNEIIPLTGSTDSRNFIIEYYTQNPSTGAVAVVGAVTTPTDSLDKLIDTTVLMIKVQVELYFNKGTDAMPYSLMLYSSDIKQTDPTFLYEPRLMSRLDLSNEIVTFFAVSDIKVQNRTAADSESGTHYDADRVDAQPLFGSIYDFPADPKMKLIGINNPNSIVLNGVPADGMRLIRAQDFTNDSYQARPSATQWTNCTGRTNVVLQPGNIKKGGCYIKITGRLVNLFAKMRHEGGDAKLHGVRCKSQYYIFEECIRSVSTNNIKVQYERKLRVGCMLKTVPHDVPLQSYVQANNETLPVPVPP